MRRFLLVPSIAKGNGSGHIVRCFSLARELSRLGEYAALYVPDISDGSSWKPAEIALAYPAETREIPVVSGFQEDAFDVILLDKRAVSFAEASLWRQFGPTVALDEGGSARSSVSYLVDILPRSLRRPDITPLEVGIAANRVDPGFLSLPERRRGPPERLGRVLITFGGEDRHGLARYAASYLVRTGSFVPEQLTVVSGALFRPRSVEGMTAYGFSVTSPGPEKSDLSGVTFLGPVQDLKEHLASYDLVVTQFGLTAFEAAWAGCAVLLLNPSRYHQALSRVSGFPECGVRSFRPKALKNALADTSRLVKAAIEAAPRRKVDLAAFIRSLNPSGLGSCPACGSLRRAAIARYARKTYFRCKDCDLVFMEYFAQREDSYQASYFFGEYERQYGKTYLEDFPALAAMAARRLDIIESLPASGKARSVVDVGCAYGAFLSESSRRGWKSFGLDLVPEAVEYVRKKLGIAAAVADFQDPSTASLLPHDLDCLSMWYVVEHFQDPGSVLETVASLLRPGGIFAFSTPSRSGISARSNPVSFFERSPDDHWTILGPGRVASILKRFGLRVMRIRITGHHPERFGKVPARPGSLKFRFFGLVSRIFALGDTFECYAVKEKER